MLFETGHGGANTADYTAKTLPGRIRLALTKIITDELNGQLDRQNVAQANPIVAAMITREIEALDAEIGARIQDICANPGVLNEQEARALTQEHFEPLLLGFNGTTLAAALVNITHRFVWGIGVGDSTVGVFQRHMISAVSESSLTYNMNIAALSTVEPNGTRHAQRLCTPHSLDDPEEVARAKSEHPPDETGVVANGRMVGWLALPRGTSCPVISGPDFLNIYAACSNRGLLAEASFDILEPPVQVPASHWIITLGRHP